MKKSHYLLLAATFIFVFLVTISWHVSRPQPTLQNNAKKVGISIRQDKANNLTETEFQVDINSQKQSKHITQEYNEISNASDFFLKAKHHVRNGGNYYSNAIVDQCQKINSLLDALNKKTPNIEVDVKGNEQREKAFNLLLRRCDGINQSKSAIAKIESNGDVLIQASDNLKNARASNDRNRIREAISNLLAIKDPLYFNQEGMRLLRHDDAIWIYGETYPLDSLDIIQAMQLIPCELGLTCDESHYLVLTTCLVLNHCYRNLPELINSEGGVDVLRTQRIFSFKNKILKAILSKNAEAFMTDK